MGFVVVLLVPVVFVPPRMEVDVPLIFAMIPRATKCRVNVEARSRLTLVERSL